MNKKIAISVGACFLAGGSLAPPDMICQITLGVAAAVLCGVTLLALASQPFVKASPSAMRTLICILVCTIAVLSVACYQLTQRIRRPAPQTMTSEVDPN